MGQEVKPLMAGGEGDELSADILVELELLNSKQRNTLVQLARYDNTDTGGGNTREVIPAVPAGEQYVITGMKIAMEWFTATSGIKTGFLTRNPLYGTDVNLRPWINRIIGFTTAAGTSGRVVAYFDIVSGWEVTDIGSAAITTVKNHPHGPFVLAAGESVDWTWTNAGTSRTNATIMMFTGYRLSAVAEPII